MILNFQTCVNLEYQTLSMCRSQPIHLYTREELLSLRPSAPIQLPQSRIDQIESFSLGKSQLLQSDYRTKRGSRGIARRRIPVIVSKSRSASDPDFTQTGANFNNLVQLNCDWPVANVRKPTKCLLVNSRSIRGKTFSLRESISEHKLDFLFITETWLSGNTNDGVFISELKPPGYEFLNFPRTGSKGGGIAVVHKNAARVSTSCPKDFKSFEWIESTGVTKHGRFKFILVYRPPPSAADGLTGNDFLTDFSDLLDSYACVNTPFVIIGDLNVRVNRQSDLETVRS